eukprot:TRINITY_DN4156_c0_g2_i5.p2 TRINITY_DN4156_c0_g2~~TRINITY_DN4156_c0_g2_i5.p2  ORF type:complete len:226 (+),score=-3.01 TRINITY_DN4156_c0_g2_i5:602-1279(+)
MMSCLTLFQGFDVVIAAIKTSATIIDVICVQYECSFCGAWLRTYCPAFNVVVAAMKDFFTANVVVPLDFVCLFEKTLLSGSDGFFTANIVVLFDFFCLFERTCLSESDKYRCFISIYITAYHLSLYVICYSTTPNFYIHAFAHIICMHMQQIEHMHTYAFLTLHTQLALFRQRVCTQTSSLHNLLKLSVQNYFDQEYVSGEFVCLLTRETELIGRGWGWGFRGVV